MFHQKSTRPVLASIVALALIATSARASTSARGSGSLGKQLLASHAWLSVPAQRDHFGNARFLPLPAGTLDPDRNVYVGQEEATLKPNEGFFLPIFYWFGEKYGDGSADDPAFPAPADFLAAEVLITLDGEVILDSAEGLDDNYVDTTYYPNPIVYPEPTPYDSVSTYFVKGLCTQHGPMSPGTHELHLVITSDFIEGLAGFAGWDNTWTITVEK